ncbi:MAG: hypothetical protein M3Q65_22135 [Chloroflexota bacterium]|nr:hypothetical protein [Chloroflexota bacterium]
MLNLLSRFSHKAEIRESRDEILVGEIVRAMARRGHPSIGFTVDADRQVLRFKAIKDPVLSYVYITLDRKTGDNALTSALLGTKATLTIAAEVKNYIADPDDLVRMYRTDFANILKLPALGGIKLNHELNSVFATTTKLIEIGNYVMKGEEGVGALSALLDGTIGDLRERLREYKKG